MHVHSAEAIPGLSTHRITQELSDFMLKLFVPWEPAGQWPAPTASAASANDEIPTSDFVTIGDKHVKLAASEAAAHETEEEAGRRFLFDRIQRRRGRAG